MEETLGLESSGDMRQFLAFRLDDDVFALDVAQIREILDRTDLTRIPKMPAFMRGVINLRGSAVPVVDMRMKFDMGSVERTIDTCIIVMEVQMESETTVIGALVDAVQEVFELEARRVEPPPRMGTRLDTRFMQGMVRRDDGFAIVLDADKVFSADEIFSVQGLGDGRGSAGDEEASSE